MTIINLVVNCLVEIQPTVIQFRMVFAKFSLPFSVAYSSKYQCVMNLNDDASWHVLFLLYSDIIFSAGFKKKL